MKDLVVKNSITLKFVALSSITVLTLSAFFSTYLFQSTKSNLYQALERRSDLLLGQIAFSAPTLLWDYETDQLQNILESQAQAKFVDALMIIDSENKVYGIKRNTEGKIKKLEQAIAIEDDFKIKELLFSEGDKNHVVGKLYLAINDDEELQILRGTRITAIFQSCISVVFLVILFLIAFRVFVFRPINNIARALENLGQGDGDLTARLPTMNNEIGKLTNAFNQFVENLQGTIKSVVDCSSDMNDPINQVYQASRHTQEGTEQQKSNMSQASEAVVCLAQAADHVAERAVVAASNSESVISNTKAVEKELHKMIGLTQQVSKDISTAAETINTLQVDVGSIVSVLEVIRGIADQTNLLALNAAIEAARAGEQGRGFAVVADEVRSLATKTQESTAEIQEMITKLEDGSSRAVEAMQVGKSSGESAAASVMETQRIVVEIFEAIDRVGVVTNEIAGAAEEQASVSSEVTNLLKNVNDTVEKVASDANDTYLSSEKIAQLLNEFNNNARRFKV